MQLLKPGRYLIDHNNQNDWSEYLSELAKDKTISENNTLLKVSLSDYMMGFDAIILYVNKHKSKDTFHIRYFYIVDMTQTHIGKSVKYYTRKDLFKRELIIVE